MRYYLPKFQIFSSPKEHFAEVWNKLAKMGFVGGNFRCKTIEEIDKYYRRSEYILIGTDDICRMVIHGTTNSFPDIPIITVDDFITNHFPAYYAA